MCKQIDAILLGSHRIGHGYALIKHPKLLQIVKERNIAIEVNPVSNQVRTLSHSEGEHSVIVEFLVAGAEIGGRLPKSSGNVLPIAKPANGHLLRRPLILGGHSIVSRFLLCLLGNHVQT